MTARTLAGELAAAAADGLEVRFDAADSGELRVSVARFDDSAADPAKHRLYVARAAVDTARTPAGLERVLAITVAELAAKVRG